jgi:quercetin dioxygenase-like cupin family protein
MASRSTIGKPEYHRAKERRIITTSWRGTPMHPSETVFVEEKTVPWEDVAVGVRRKILGYDPNLMMTIVDFKKGSIGARHKHPHTQVSYIVRGSFEVHVAEERKVLNAGDCFFIPSNVEHSVLALEAGTLVDVFAPFREDFLGQNS